MGPGEPMPMTARAKRLAKLKAWKLGKVCRVGAFAKAKVTPEGFVSKLAGLMGRYANTKNAGAEEDARRGDSQDAHLRARAFRAVGLQRRGLRRGRYSDVRRGHGRRAHDEGERAHARAGEEPVRLRPRVHAERQQPAGLRCGLARVHGESRQDAGRGQGDAEGRGDCEGGRRGRHRRRGRDRERRRERRDAEGRVDAGVHGRATRLRVPLRRAGLEDAAG